MLKATQPPSCSNSNKKDTSSDIAYGMPPPTNQNTASRLAQIDDLKLFFATATQQWDTNKPLKRFGLPAGESVSCVLWNDLFFITGTDIVRSLTFRFYAFGRPVTNAKKFEEGIFSDLRNLKPGHDARLEEPKSELLDMLYKNNCIRTQKKQKVFYWFSVPHDRLFLDALERDLKREKMGMEPTTQAIAEPASSLSLDSTQELFDQLRKSMSQSAAATAQAIEEDLSISSNSNSNNGLSNYTNSNNDTTATTTTTSTNWNSQQPLTHTPWSASQSRLERAASQAIKRSRVNSVPASLGQQQQFQLLQQQKHHRMSHGSYFANHNTTSSSASLPRSRSTTRHYRNSIGSTSSLLSNSHDDTNMLFTGDDATSTTTSTTLTENTTTVSSPIHAKFNHQDYMDPISNGVDQLEITASLSNQSSTSSTSLLSHHNVLPSKSLDSNAIKKTKTIFGNLSLFDGSPTYKQRRRRAASVSSSALNSSNSGGPERVSRRHDKCHLRNTPSTTNSQLPLVNNHSSRLAMAAVKAGFAPNQIISPVQPMMHHNHHYQSHANTNNWSTHPQHQQTMIDYLCPITNCGRLFKRSDHLERHMNTIHTFICNLCGKQFSRSENLAQHHHIHHHSTANHLMNNGNGGGGGDNNYDDDNNQRGFNNGFNTYQRQLLNHHHNNSNDNDTSFYSSPPRHSFDGSRSSGWSTTNLSNNTGSVSSSHCSGSSNNSPCSTLSPMSDLDFDMPDIQQPSQHQSSLSSSIINQQQPSRSNTSLTTIDSTTMLKSTTSTTASSVRNLSFEDDFSSSSASSPSSTLPHYNSNSHGNNMTLLSPFKPFGQPQQLQQQHMGLLQQQQLLAMNNSNNNSDQQLDEYQFVDDVSMLLNPTDYASSNYAPYTIDHQSSYTPSSLITSPDNMNIVFGA